MAALAEADALPPPPPVALPAGMRWVERARAMSLLPSRRLWWWMVVDGGGCRLVMVASGGVWLAWQSDSVRTTHREITVLAYLTN